MNEMDFAAVTVSSGGETLRGDLTSRGPDAPLVVLCHGIPLSRPDPSDPGYRGICLRLAEEGVSALFVNFRGCGDSTGDFHMGGWYSDLCSVVDFAKSEVASRRLCLAGFSAGGALAIKYAAERGGVDGVASFAAPAGLSRVFAREHTMQLIEAARDVGTIKDPAFPPSPDWFYEDARKNEAIDFVSRVSPAPLLIVHGEQDELVPVSQGRELFEAAGEPRELVVLPAGEHRLRRDPRSVDILLAWVRKL